MKWLILNLIHFTFHIWRNKFESQSLVSWNGHFCSRKGLSTWDLQKYFLLLCSPWHRYRGIQYSSPWEQKLRRATQNCVASKRLIALLCLRQMYNASQCKISHLVTPTSNPLFDIQKWVRFHGSVHQVRWKCVFLCCSCNAFYPYLQCIKSEHFHHSDPCLWLSNAPRELLKFWILKVFFRY